LSEQAKSPSGDPLAIIYNFRVLALWYQEDFSLSPCPQKLWITCL